MVNGWQSGYLSRISYVTKLPGWVVEGSWGRGGNAGGEEESAIEVKAGEAWVIIYGCPTPTPTSTPAGSNNNLRVVRGLERECRGMKWKCEGEN